MTTNHPTRTETQPISQTGPAPTPSRFSKSQVKLLAHVESAREKLQTLSPRELINGFNDLRVKTCLLYTSPSPRD